MVLAGDIVGGSVPRLQWRVAPLAELRAKEGRFLALGNHVYYSGAAAWVQKFRQLMPLASNSTRTTQTTIDQPSRSSPIAATAVEAVVGRYLSRHSTSNWNRLSPICRRSACRR